MDPFQALLLIFLLAVITTISLIQTIIRTKNLLSMRYTLRHIQVELGQIKGSLARIERSLHSRAEEEK